MRTLQSYSRVLIASSLLLVPGCETKETARGAAVGAGQVTSAREGAMSKSIHELTMKRLDGTPVSLKDYEGTVLLVVNTASECGYTPQYEGLEALHEKYASRGFAVLGFPSNDFGGQEPGSSTEIATFCRTKYGIKFPMFEKVVTTGPKQSELYGILSSSFGAPKWNFHKYLVDKHGVPVKAWPSATTPDSAELADAIEELLGAP